MPSYYSTAIRLIASLLTSRKSAEGCQLGRAFRGLLGLLLWGDEHGLPGPLLVLDDEFGIKLLVDNAVDRREEGEVLKEQQSTRPKVCLRCEAAAEDRLCFTSRRRVYVCLLRFPFPQSSAHLLPPLGL
jgi:hypothetical protein